jgi:hypothetical protein
MSDNALKFPLQGSMRSFSSTRANDFQQNQAKALPVHVTKVDKDFVYVSFEPTNGIWTLPTIKLPQSFSAYQREPTQVKDKGYAVPSDYYTGGTTGLGGGNANFQPRGNLTTLSFQPLNTTSFPSRDYDQHTISGGPTGVKIWQKVPPSTTTQPPPNQPNPQKLSRLSIRAKQAWLNSRTPIVPIQQDTPPKLSFMQIDKDGLITHQSPSGDHLLTVEENNKKVTVAVPLSSHVYLGGDGKTGTYAPVITVSGPCKNVFGRTG